MLSYLADTLIFILVGVVITEMAANDITAVDVAFNLALYLALTVIRSVFFLGKLSLTLRGENLPPFLFKKVCEFDKIFPPVLITFRNI